MNKRRWILVFLLCAALLSGCQKQEHADVAEAVRAGAVLGENIVIDGIPVSGMAVAEARKRLLSVRQEQLQAVCFTVAAGEKQVNCNAADLGAGYDVDEALLQALSLSAYYPAANAPRNIESSFFIDEYMLAKEAKRIAEALSFAPQNAAAAYDKTKNAFVYTADQPGQSVSPQTIAPLLAQSLRNGAQERLDVPFDALAAEYTLADAKADTALVASFSTSFSGKTYGKAGRVFNIEKAASLINGVTLQSGEEFDMNALLGPRTGENGWKEATGIRDAVYVQEYGGGV
ncbi:MAG: VanW family protein, partial [Clostridia bacterium]|nr:VanW family protein [Clostridia bacterium]